MYFVTVPKTAFSNRTPLPLLMDSNITLHELLHFRIRTGVNESVQCSRYGRMHSSWLFLCILLCALLTLEIKDFKP